jgi:hypothetical protein
MTSKGFHVHGPHDHEIEHAIHHAPGHDAKMTNQIALFTAVIATVGAIFSYMGGATQANASLYKSNAAIAKTEASNQWNYFQAKSTKQSIAEISRDLSPADQRATYQARIDRYESEKNEIKAAAEKTEEKAKQWDRRSDDQLHMHHRWTQATTVLQVSIALAAIALLTRKKQMEWVMLGAGALGVGVGVLAALHI